MPCQQHRQDTFQYNKAKRMKKASLASNVSHALAQTVAERKSARVEEEEVIDVNVHQDAIDAFSVVAALVLGFSFSALVAVACELTSALSSGNLYVGTFCLIMSVSTAASGYSTVFFTMEVYYAKRLAQEADSRRNTNLRVETFLAMVAYRRKVARNATVGALALDMIAIGILIWGFLPSGIGYAVLTCLCGGAVLVLLTMSQMRTLTAFCLGLGEEEESSEETTAVPGDGTTNETHPTHHSHLRRGVDGEAVIHRRASVGQAGGHGRGSVLGRGSVTGARGSVKTTRPPPVTAKPPPSLEAMSHRPKRRSRLVNRTSVEPCDSTHIQEEAEETPPLSKPPVRISRISRDCGGGAAAEDSCMDSWNRSGTSEP